MLKGTVAKYTAVGTGQSKYVRLAIIAPSISTFGAVIDIELSDVKVAVNQGLPTTKPPIVFGLTTICPIDLPLAVKARLPLTSA